MAEPAVFMLVLSGTNVDVQGLHPAYAGLVKAGTAWSVTSLVQAQTFLFQLAAAARAGAVVHPRWGFARGHAPPASFVAELGAYWETLMRVDDDDMHAFLAHLPQDEPNADEADDLEGSSSSDSGASGASGEIDENGPEGHVQENAGLP